MLDEETRREISETMDALKAGDERRRVRWVRKLEYLTGKTHTGEMSAKALFSISGHEWAREMWEHIQELEARLN